MKLKAGLLLGILLVGCKATSGGTPGATYGEWSKVASGEFLSLKGDIFGPDSVCDTFAVSEPPDMDNDPLPALSEGFSYGDSVKFYVSYLHGTDTLYFVGLVLAGDDAPPNDSIYGLTHTLYAYPSFFSPGQDTALLRIIINDAGGPFDHYVFVASLDTSKCRPGGTDSARVRYEIWRKGRLR